MSFRVQIAVFGALVVGLALLVFSLLLYGLAAGSLGTTQDRDLAQRSERVLGSLSAAALSYMSPTTVLGFRQPIASGSSTASFKPILPERALVQDLGSASPAGSSPSTLEPLPPTTIPPDAVPPSQCLSD